MPNPFTAPLVAFASRLKHPTLFKLTVALMLVSWLWLSYSALIRGAIRPR